MGTDASGSTISTGLMLRQRTAPSRSWLRPTPLIDMSEHFIETAARVLVGY